MYLIDPNELILAYTNGYFPMAHPEEDNTIYWHRPDLRGIIPLDSFKVPKNLARTYRQGIYEQKIDGDFEACMQMCAERESTWISEEIIASYLKLYEMGFAHSFESWKDGKLVGGLYGVSISKAFFGESMFFRERDASKTALVFLVEHLKKEGFTLLDTQYLNPHLVQFGGVEIPDEDYQKMLAEAMG